MLLILDNFEQVVDAGRRCRAGSARGVLVTSQTPLRVRGERVIRLGPLELPDVDGRRSRRLAEVPSVALLVAHARAARIRASRSTRRQRRGRRPHLRPARRPAARARARRRSPGLVRPGGAELAARRGPRRVRVSGAARSSTAPARAARGARLDLRSARREAELALLLRLAVFAGGFTSLVEAVAASAVPGATTTSAIEQLAALFDVALVRRERGGRYRMSPPVRLYALERLRRAAASRDARVRQAEALIAVAERPRRCGGRTSAPPSGRSPRRRRTSARRSAALRGVDAGARTRSCSPPPRASSATPAAPPSASAEIDFALAVASLADPPRAAPVPASDRGRERRSAGRLRGRRRRLPRVRHAAATSSRRCSACPPATASSPTARERCGPPARPRPVARGLNDRVATDLADLATGTALALARPPRRSARARDPARPPRPTRRPHRHEHHGRARRHRPGLRRLRRRARRATAAGCAPHHALNSYFTEAFQLDGAAMALTALERFEEAVVAAEISDLLRARTDDRRTPGLPRIPRRRPRPRLPSPRPGRRRAAPEPPPAASASTTAPSGSPATSTPPQPSNPRVRRPISDPRQTWLEWPRSALFERRAANGSLSPEGPANSDFLPT